MDVPAVTVKRGCVIYARPIGIWKTIYVGAVRKTPNATGEASFAKAAIFWTTDFANPVLPFPLTEARVRSAATRRNVRRFLVTRGRQKAAPATEAFLPV